MNEPAFRAPSADRRWPMTVAAWHSLVDEIARLRLDVAVLAGGAAARDGVVHLPVIRAANRLDGLSAVLEASEQVDAPDRAVIGRRVTLLEDDGSSVTYSLVFPGDGDPTQGWISADSPLGAAVMGASPGAQVAVLAPVGRRIVTVLSVE